MLNVTILGCGSSGGVPLIGNVWGSCDPNNPRNRRRRSSILIQSDTTTVLVDTTPDLREQLLDAKCKDVSAVLYTHAHADHLHGIDDLRSLNMLMQKPIPVYAEASTLQEIMHRFNYAFSNLHKGAFWKPVLEPQVMRPGEPVVVGDLTFMPFIQQHGYTTSLGFRCAEMAYSTDVRDLDEQAFAALKGVKVWIVDCLREEPHPTHTHLAKTLDWIERVKPDQAWLTHMGHELDYEQTAKKLPAGVAPAWDGLVVRL